ncbi:MAG: class I mannose-6-phosphate isomerase [Polymorphobacter sp.]
MAAKPHLYSAGPENAAKARLLVPQALAKPWGRRALGPWGLNFDLPDTTIGEIHHVDTADDDPELLVKTLFTGERLSVQVHPDAATARTLGARRGKDEAWVVLAAEPGAVIGLGLHAVTDAAALRGAALDGSIADMLVWHPCAAGDVFFTPAGTIHAIGAGVTLFEVQQNLDLTWRLFDYGRGRELHLDAALSVATLGPWQPSVTRPAPGEGRTLRVEGPSFCLEQAAISGKGQLAPAPRRPLWMAVVSGGGKIDGVDFTAGEVWRIDGAVTVIGQAAVVFAYPGDTAPSNLWRDI